MPSLWLCRIRDSITQNMHQSEARRAHLDEFASLNPLLEGAAHLVRREVEGRVGGGDALLDGLDGGSVPLLEGLDGIEYHLQDGGIGRETRLFAVEMLDCCTAVSGPHVCVL